MDSKGREFASKIVDTVWERGKPIPGKDPNLYRQDIAGNTIHELSDGKDSEMGWQIDHKKPVVKGGRSIWGACNRSKQKRTRKRVISILGCRTNQKGKARFRTSECSRGGTRAAELDRSASESIQRWWPKSMCSKGCSALLCWREEHILEGHYCPIPRPRPIEWNKVDFK